MLEERFDHHREVASACKTCARPVHLAQRKGDGRWFWVHDKIMPAKLVAAHRCERHDAEVSAERAVILIGGGHGAR